MKTATVREIAERLRQAGKQLSIDRVVAEFQSAFLCADQCGFYAGLIVALFVAASFLLQAARSIIAKGVL